MSFSVLRKKAEFMGEAGRAIEISGRSNSSLFALRNELEKWRWLER